MRRFFICIGCVLFAVRAFSSTIVWDAAFMDDSDPRPERTGLCHFAYDNNGYGFAWFGVGLNLDFYYDDYDSHNLEGVVITPDSGGGLAYAMNIRKMEVGDTVSEETVRGDQSYFYSNWIDAEPGYDGGSPATSSAFIPTGGEIYFGFLVEDWTDSYFYGWLSLIFDGSEVRVGQSAVEASGGPIIIQPRSIPEPGAAVLIVLGAAAFLLRRGSQRAIVV